jgi:hypothetical protein
MEEGSTTALQYGGHVAICRHLLAVTAGSDFVLYLDSLKRKENLLRLPQLQPRTTTGGADSGG